MTLKLWKKFDSQAFSEVLVLFMTTRCARSMCICQTTKYEQSFFLINLRPKSCHFNALVNLLPNIPVKLLEKVPITGVIFDVSHVFPTLPITKSALRNFVHWKLYGNKLKCY